MVGEFNKKKTLSRGKNTGFSVQEVVQEVSVQEMVETETIPIGFPVCFTSLPKHPPSATVGIGYSSW